MKRLVIFAALLLATVVGFRAAPVFANSLAAASEKLTTVARDQVVDGSAFLAGETVVIEGIVKGDVFCAGKEVTITGTIEGDVLCAGATRVTIAGVVKGDVRIASADIAISGVVDGNATLAGVSITTASTAKIGHDLSVAGSKVAVSGEIGRDVRFGGEEVTFSGAIGRDVQGETPQLHIGSATKIGGSVSYTSDNEARFPAGVVAGSVVRVAPTSGGYFGQSRMSFATLLVVALVSIMSFVVLAVIVGAIIPRYITRVSTASTVGEFAKLFLVGLVACVVMPLLIFFLLISAIGMYAALVLGFAFVVVILVAPVLVAYRLGKFMLVRNSQVILHIALGAVVLGILSIIPFVGWIFGFVAMMIGVGMIVLGMKTQYAVKPVVEELPTIMPKKKTKRS